MGAEGEQGSMKDTFNNELEGINMTLLHISNTMKEEATIDQWNTSLNNYEDEISNAKCATYVNAKFLVMKKLIERIEKQVRIEAEKDRILGLNEYYWLIKGKRQGRDKE